MKILFIGDPHTKLSNLDLSQEMYSLAIKRAKEHNCHYICDLGDTFDNYSLIQSQALRVYVNFVNQVKAHGIHLIKLVGNHDYEDTQKCKKHAFEFLKSFDGVTLVEDKTHVVTTNVDDKNTSELWLFPFRRDNAQFVEEVSSIQNQEEHSYLICHQGFNGYDYGDGYIAETDVDLDNNKWGFTRIISGHFHKPAGDLYVGTPFSHNFKEPNQRKRFVVLDTGNNQWTDIPITEFKRHVMIDVVLNGSEIKIVNEFGYDLERDEVRIMVEGKREDHHLVSDEDIRKVFGEKIDIRRTYLSDDQEVKISENLNKKDMVKSYFSIKNIKSDTVLDLAYKYLDQVS